MKFIKNFNDIQILLLSLWLFSSCLPEQSFRSPIDLDNAQISNGDDTTTNPSTGITGKLPQTTNFLQQGSVKTSTTLSLESDFKDSFLIRGNDLISLLEQRVLLTQKNFCLVSFYPGVTASGTKNVLITSARIRFFFNSAIGTKEYFLQVDPNNEIINQSDCLTVSLTSKLTSIFGASSFAFKISDLCPNCTTSISSTGLRLFETTGTEEKNAKISFLFLNIIPDTGSAPQTAPSCSSDANCSGLNFNCCLDGQCVQHASIKSSTDQSSNEFLIAEQLIAGKPELIKDYKHLFHVCPNMVSTDQTGANDSSTPPIDPAQLANDLFSELLDLYNCTTPKLDEFSICVKEFENGSELMKSSSFTFSATKDDLNFSGVNSTLAGQNNIVQVDFAGQVLFKEKLLSTDTKINLPTGASLSSSNDSFSQAQSITMQQSPPSNAINDIVKIYYKVDGTCQKLGSTLARCTKIYTQGQSSTPARSSDHSTGNNSFALPTYADLSFNIIVKLNSSAVPEGTDSWALSGRNVVFNTNTMPVFTGQKVEITYFVTSNVAEITQSTTAAQNRIDQHCKCDPLKDPCSLKPITSKVAGIDTVTSFQCIYPDPDVAPPPLQRTVFVSAKAVPHKFYDSFGVNIDLGDTPSNSSQEGIKFEYTDGNILKPNNVGKYIGFNEIYGTMNAGPASALPPKVIAVAKGKSYDLFVDQGAFSTCLNCGSDYFSTLQKVFPNNFKYQAGGYLPAINESRRTSNRSDYPADDFRFGRACFVPTTMIPWTHRSNTDVTTQRRNRLAAQHFLFANGYNKDWYGFDYGALIGSFDGVKWFAVGNQRRIKAEGNKLYLATNAYFGDLTINNSFQVTINEINSVLNSGSFVNHDTDNDGAQCQRSHFCSTDEDCITQLGYDYSCVNVSAYETPWPIFDNNGNELTGNLTRNLLGLVGGANGQVNRCVYRGVGSICNARSFSVNPSDSYTNSSNEKIHSCSVNSFCANLSKSEFNTSISRFADTAANQNIQSFITTKTDRFGLATRILGRPQKYYGDQTPPSSVKLHLNQNNIDSICVPGKDIENISTMQDLNFLSTTTKQADKINNVGRTFSSVFFQDENYFAACPATDQDGNYTHLQEGNLNDPTHSSFAIKNNMSTNSLNLPALASQNLFNDKSSLVTSIGYHKNTCLRAPGASCFSDFECAANDFIANKFKSVTNFSGQISKAEENFWEESLICGNSQPRLQTGFPFPNPVYDPTTHKCCRETAKSFTYSSQAHEGSDFDVINNSNEVLIPGFNQDINDPRRYSRTHTVYDKLTQEAAKYPPLVTAAPRPSSPLVLLLQNLRQYNTLHLHNERMCCTGHWVRKFASGSNAVNGGTHFSGASQQNIPIQTFKSLAFAENNFPPQNSFPADFSYDPTLLPFTCNIADHQTSDCEVRNSTEGSAFEKKYLDWFAKFELIGIPQVLIETNETVEKPISTNEEIDIDNNGVASSGITSPNFIQSSPDIDQPQMDISFLKLPIENTIKDVNNGGVVDAIFNGENFYSAASYDNFEIGTGKLKKIFSEDQFNCCIPTGIQVENGTPRTSCCSGTINQDDNEVSKCCLDDFTDLSVYTNRYVSSEGAFFNNQEISDNDIDPKSGYIKKEIVLQMAAQMCCSGQATFGKVINDYLIPINFDKRAPKCPKTRRFAFIETLDNAKAVDGGVAKYKAGVKWNNHVYCVPPNFDEEVTDCNDGSAGGGAVSE